MAKGFIGATGYKAYLGATKMKAGYIGATRVYSTGSTVTYVVDNGVSYAEEVDSEASCLSPRTFTPSKTEWTFVGWRQDKTASGSVLSNLTMGDNPITLYAVFRQTVTVTYYNGSTTASSKTGYRYYNTGNVANPSFTLTQAAMSGWTARGWSTSTAGNGGITYANGAAFTRDSNITLYGMYQQTITLSYNGNGATGGSNVAQTGTRYYNSGTGAIANPSFTLSASGFVRTNYAFAKWALNSGSGTQYAVGAAVTLDANATMYAVWVQNVQEFGYTGGMQSYTVPTTGIYQLIVYGAEGGKGGGAGHTIYAGGKGGYAVGYATLTAGQVLYIGVGGAGAAYADNGPAGGYNGGGRAGINGTYYGGGSGGGATHIGTRNDRLVTYGNTNNSGLYIVAGGGGGGAYKGPGGTGGGTNGGNGSNLINSETQGLGKGGTQNAGGATVSSPQNPGTYGQGGSGYTEGNAGYGGAGGGGGLYGGSGGGPWNGGCPGGGGSGYIGGVPAFTYGGVTYSPGMLNDQRSGNGYAKITFIRTT